MWHSNFSIIFKLNYGHCYRTVKCVFCFVATATVLVMKIKNNCAVLFKFRSLTQKWKTARFLICLKNEYCHRNWKQLFRYVPTTTQQRLFYGGLSIIVATVTERNKSTSLHFLFNPQSLPQKHSSLFLVCRDFGRFAYKVLKQCI